MRFVLLLVLVMGACRCGDDEATTSATSAASVMGANGRARLELADDVVELRATALAMAWLGESAVIGRRGGFVLGGRELPAPAYLGGAIDVTDGVVRAWPYELADEAPRELPVPEGPAIVSARWTPSGWLALRDDVDTRELVRLDATTAQTIASVPGSSVLAVDGDRIAALGTRAWVVEGEAARELSAPRYEVRAAMFVGEQLVGLDATGALVVWSLATGRSTTLVAHLGAGSTLDVRGAHLATGGSDGRVAVWRTSELPSDTERATEPLAEITFAGSVDALVWIDDSTLAAAVTEGRRARVVRLRLRDRDR